MRGIKTFVDNLANRINQPHYLEKELRKVFNAGIEHQKIKQELLAEYLTFVDEFTDGNYEEFLLKAKYRDEILEIWEVLREKQVVKFDTRFERIVGNYSIIINYILNEYQLKQ